MRTRRGVRALTTPFRRFEKNFVVKQRRISADSRARGESNPPPFGRPFVQLARSRRSSVIPSLEPSCFLRCLNKEACARAPLRAPERAQTPVAVLSTPPPPRVSPNAETMSLARGAAGAVALRAPRSRVAGRRVTGRRSVVSCTAVHLKFELEGHPEARVVGGHPALGGWNTAGGVKNGDIITIADASQIEYKWVDGDTWEVRDNRLLTLPALADPESSVALAVRDRARPCGPRPSPPRPGATSSRVGRPRPRSSSGSPSARRTRSPRRDQRANAFSGGASGAPSSAPRGIPLPGGTRRAAPPAGSRTPSCTRSRPSGSAAARAPPSSSRTASA